MLLRIIVLIGFCAFAFEAQSGEAQPAPQTALTGFPFTDEDLNYTLNWPGGINLGEAHLHAKHSGPNWDFRMTLDASIPGFEVRDIYSGESTADLCSSYFDRSTTHGSRKVDEKETVDRDRGVVSRTTGSGGGHSDIPVPKCVKDALTFLFYTREEMGQGRVPSAQQFIFGSLYEMSLVYAGAPMVTVGGKQLQSDELNCTVKGPSSELKFDIYFARDPARTPLVVKVPFAMGTFSMELIR